RLIDGCVDTGTGKGGNELGFSLANKNSFLNSIVCWQANKHGLAIAGDSIGITLREQIFVERGYVGSHQKDAPIETNRFHAGLFWIARQPAQLTHLYSARLATQEMKCQIASIEQVIDSASLERTSSNAQQLTRNE